MDKVKEDIAKLEQLKESKESQIDNLKDEVDSIDDKISNLKLELYTQKYKDLAYPCEYKVKLKTEKDTIFTVKYINNITSLVSWSDGSKVYDVGLIQENIDNGHWIVLD